MPACVMFGNLCSRNSCSEVGVSKDQGPQYPHQTVQGPHDKDTHSRDPLIFRSSHVRPIDAPWPTQAVTAKPQPCVPRLVRRLRCGEPQPGGPGSVGHRIIEKNHHSCIDSCYTDLYNVASSLITYQPKQSNSGGQPQ